MEAIVELRWTDLSDLVEAHQAGMWRYLRFLGCDASQAEDLTQEAFLALMKNPVPDPTGAYLRTIARNLFLKSKRSRIKPVPLEGIDAVWMDCAGEDGGESYLKALRECLEVVDDRSRTVIRMRFRDRARQEHIATATGLAKEGVKTLLRRAKERLFQCVKGKLAHE